MYTINVMSNTQRFLSVVNRCRGTVLLHLPDGRACDLKTDCAAYQLLGLMKGPCGSLRISLSDPRDSALIIQYLMEAAVA